MPSRLVNLMIRVTAAPSTLPSLPSYVTDKDCDEEDWSDRDCYYVV